MTSALTARIVSVNVSRPRAVVWRGGVVQTGIFKDPVTGQIALRHDNLDGDE